MRPSRALAVTLGACLGCGVPAGDDAADPKNSDSSACGPAQATVRTIVDGDTVDLDDGERVRYLLIDAPETTYGRTDCFGAAAVTLNTELVLGRSVTLTYDVQCRDRFGRLLAYVAVAGRDVNRLFVERGFACVLHIPPNGAGRIADYAAAEAAARATGRGMWGACADVACDP